MTRVAIIAALPGELQPLVRGWEHESRNGVQLWRWRHHEGQWIAACAGVGMAAAARAFAEIEREEPVDAVVSTGWAGALEEKYSAGRAYRVSGVIDADTGERTRTAASPGECWLVTAHRVADQADKRRLAAAHGAGLVDMEAAGIARLAAQRGLPFHCVKGVSDGPADRLPDFNAFLSAEGRFHLVRFVLTVLVRPWHWAALGRMGGNSRKAAQGLREELLHLLDAGATLRRDGGPPTPRRQTPD
jgi:adenosylhomocysteine nucleosidase